MEKEKEIRIEELLIDDVNDIGVFGISFVKNPAHESDFVFMSTDSTKTTTNIEKRMIYGPAIIPDKKIKRYDEAGNPYYVYMSGDTVEQLSQKYMKNHFQDSFTIEHGEKLKGKATVVEQWLVADKNNDKSNSLNVDVPDRTWMVGIKCEKGELWDSIKSGKVKGLSIEAFMTSQLIKNSISLEEKTLKDFKELINNELKS